MYFGFSLALIIAALFPALSISLRDDLTLTRTELEILIKVCSFMNIHTK